LAGDFVARRGRWGAKLRMPGRRESQTAVHIRTEVSREDKDSHVENRRRRDNAEREKERKRRLKRNKRSKKKQNKVWKK
jgi:hypothetical protein